MALDCCANGVKVTRYKQVDCVRIPDDMLTEFRQYNKDKCEMDSLMPKFSPTMRLASLTKTHFTTANKLAQDASRTFFNEGNAQITYKPENVEGHKILEEGVLCVVYKPELMLDTEAFMAVMNADNENADLEMEEDEVQAQGRVENAIALCQNKGDAKAVFEFMQKAGLRAYSELQTKALISFRLALSSQVAQCFRTCAFYSASGQVRLRPEDFGVVTKIDPRAQWVKVSIMMRQYTSTVNEKVLSGPKASLVQWTGRKVLLAKRIGDSCIRQLAQESALVVEIESSIVRVVRHYPVKNSCLDKVLLARTGFFSQIGKLVLRIGGALEQAQAKATAKGKELQETDRATVVSSEMAGKLGEIEHKYSSALMAAGEYTEASLPRPAHARDPKLCKSGKDGRAPGAGAGNAAPALGAGAGPIELSKSGNVEEFDEIVIISEASILLRLGIEALPADVKLRTLSFLTDRAIEDASDAEESKSEDDEDDDRATRELRKFTAKLMSLRKKPADSTGISAWGGDINYGGKSYSVNADDLFPHTKKTTTKPVHFRLPKYEWVMLVQPAMLMTAMCVLRDAFLMSFDAVDGVAIDLLGEKDKLPFKLRVVATRKWKPKELVFVPHTGGDLVRTSDLAATQKFQVPDASQMGDSLTVSARVKVRGLEKLKKSEDAKQVPTATFLCISPLFFARQSMNKGTNVLDVLSPFWAVGRSRIGKECNMQMEMLTFGMPPVAIAGGDKMPNPIKKQVWAADVQCCRNHKKIEAGDVLYIAAMEDALGDD